MNTLATLPSIKKFVHIGDGAPYDSYDLIGGAFHKPAGTFFGIETEIGAIGSEEDCYDDFRDNDNHEQLEGELREIVGPFAAIHEDCGAWEVDSPPLRYNEALRYLDFLFNRKFAYASPEQSVEWGMHVHISKGACKGAHLYRMLQLLLNQNNDTRRVMEAIAERDITDGWAYLPPFEDLVKEDEFDDEYAHYEDFMLKSSKDRKYICVGSHRGKKVYKRRLTLLMETTPDDRDGITINTDHGTHEFRLFRSTIDVEKAKANLQCVKTWVEFSRHSNERSIHAWLDYVMRNKEKYPELYSWMMKRRLI